MFHKSIITLFSGFDTRSMFISVHNYTNNYNEVATLSLCWHVDYVNAVKKAMKIIEDYKPDVRDTKPNVGLSDLKLAQYELIRSFKDTLTLGEGNNPRYTQKDTYIPVKDKYGKVISGIKLHARDDVLHLSNAIEVKKIIHRPGVYPTVNSAPLTIAKNILRSKTPLGKWRQFKLERSKFEKLTIQRENIYNFQV
jgi:hypothetical protein